MSRWQRWALRAGLAGLAAGLTYDADATAFLVMALVSPFFLCAVALRGAALWHFWRHPVAAPPPPASSLSPFGAGELAGGDWPVYSILVPLYREAELVDDLVRALDRLDWPADRREILFATETDDVATRRALVRAIGGRAGMHVVVVPAGEPRTKPRALMYTLGLARGDLVVVYDAEDEPAPDQLRLAHARLCRPDGRVGCVQARLNVYNARHGFMTRQFALEYTALFDAILPSLRRLGLPVPLGGTSNHFRRDVLDAVGGWDPYNVTEDADLGIRLARAGWQVEILPSTTWEEAPPVFRIWLGQRARWLKGWMQTCLVHLRRPVTLWRELGPRAFAGCLVVMTAMILSAFVHPLVYGFAAWSLATGQPALWPPDESWRAAVWWLGAGNLMLAYGLGMALTIVTARKRHGAGLAWHAIFIPIYWLMISLAAYRALIDLVRAPFHWRKTTHAGRRGGAAGSD